MKAQSDLRVTNPPPKPLMIWDGECHFCRRWIERWREITANEVDYVTYQEAAERFPEIPLGGYAIALGRRRSSANLFLGPAVVSPRTRPHLSDRVRLALVANGRTYRRKRRFAGKSISAGSS